MKVILLNTLFPPEAHGGAERSVAILVRSLESIGADVVVVTLAPSESCGQDELDGVRVCRLPLWNIYWPFGPARQAPMRALWHGLDVDNRVMERRVSRLLELERPQMLHTHN